VRVDAKIMQPMVGGCMSHLNEFMCGRRKMRQVRIELTTLGL
jgi:hypothetical protein